MTMTTLEQSCLDTYRLADDCWPVGVSSEDDAWTQFALASVLYGVRVVRELRLARLHGETSLKADASPVTTHEIEIEMTIRDHLANFCPEATFFGEESGGEIREVGIAAAVDPVDGTWALLNRMNTCAVVFAAFRSACPFLGVVGIPATGEIGYTIGDQRTRLIQMGLSSGDDAAVSMPLDIAKPSGVIVNVHPSRGIGPVMQGLIAAWQEEEVQMVRMEGGSPAAALLDVAKGTSVYVNLWGERPAEPFDLVAGVSLVRNAGGQVVDLDGVEINSASHAGPFVAGVDDVARERVIHEVRAALG
jgi:fructose-1,6-bisphosphatase/inositol monophosphatase family enzyme